MAKQNNEKLTNGFDSKAMLLENGKKGTVIRYNDRVRLKIIKETRHYKEGKIITPHKVMGEALVKQGIAEVAKEEEKD